MVAIDQKRNEKEGSDNCRGFTLIELIITLTIIVIVASIAVVSFQKMAINSSLKSAARDIAADFAQLKARAISGDSDATTPGNIVIRMYRISLNVAGNSYQLQQCNNPGSPCGGWTTIQNKNLSGYANDIIFDSVATNIANCDIQTRGTVNPWGTVGLSNSRGSTARIVINSTGRTRVEFTLQ